MRNLFVGFLFFSIIVSCSDNSAISIDESGKGVSQGSYATMLTIGNKLYIVNNEALITFDVSKSNQPVKVDEKNVGFEIESIYHHENVLLIGSSTFLHIYELVDGIPIRQSSTQYNTITGVQS